MHAFRFDSLRFREQFFVWSLRVGCARVVVNDERTEGMLSEAFGAARCIRALPPVLELAAALVYVSQEAGVSPDVRCTSCRFLGGDELRLLHTVTALQCGQCAAAERCYAHLRRTSCRVLIEHCSSVAVAFAELGWRFALVARVASPATEAQRRLH